MTTPFRSARMARTLVLLPLCAIPVLAQERGDVIVDGRTLFRITERVGLFTPAERAASVSVRVAEAAENDRISVEAIAAGDNDTTSDVMADGQVLMSVTERDAQVLGRPRAEVARAYAEAIRAAVREYRAARSARSLTKGAAITAAATLAWCGAVWVALRLARRAAASFEKWATAGPARTAILGPLGAGRDAGFVRLARQAAAFVAFLALTQGYLYVVAGQFPATRGLERWLGENLGRPLRELGAQFAASLPDLLYIAVVALITIFLLRLLRAFFSGIAEGAIPTGGFHRDWAEPTSKLLALLLVVAAIVIAFPYVPGAKSPAFQGMVVLGGVLFSLGSSSFVANALAGVVLIYMRPFREGQRVRIADTLGDVIEKNLLVTRIRTVKNEEITIANSLILANQVVNYSNAAEREGLILYAEVTIGYDVPWRKVHEALLKAGRQTQHVCAEPRPFVLQTALNDSYVHYQINLYTKAPALMSKIYSELRENIQDVFNQAGIEILSPAYHAVRDGNESTIPREYRPPGYQAPPFRVAAPEPPPRDR